MAPDDALAIVDLRLAASSAPVAAPTVRCLQQRFDVVAAPSHSTMAGSLSVFPDLGERAMWEQMRDNPSRGARHARPNAPVDSGLVRLGEVADYKVADADPDIRGWEVKTADERKVGSVDDLIVDTAAMRVRHVEVKADKNLLGVGAPDRYFLVPIGAARLNEAGNELIVDRVPAGGFTAAWSYERGRFTSEREAALLTAYGYDTTEETSGTGSGSNGDLGDDRRFWGNRRSGRETEPYITRAGE